MVFIGTSGDWEHHQLTFRMPRSWNGNARKFGWRMCPTCKLASARSEGESAFFTGHAASNATYSNVLGPNSCLWEGSEETHNEWLLSLKDPNKLAQSPCFKNWMIWHDLLHVLYRGILPEFVGSVLKVLSIDQFWCPGKSVAVNLSRGFSLCERFCRDRGLGSLSLDEITVDNMQGDHGFAELPGKAADCKLFALWLPTQTKRYMEILQTDQSRVIDAHLACKFAYGLNQLPIQ